MIWLTLVILAFTVAFSRDYTDDDIQQADYYLEEAPELIIPAKRRQKYIVLRFKESFKEFHLSENSYDGLASRKKLLSMKAGDWLTVGFRKPDIFHLSPNELLFGRLEPLTLSDSSNTYLTLAHYNKARHVNNRWGLMAIAVVAISIYAGMKPK